MAVIEREPNTGVRASTQRRLAASPRYPWIVLVSTLFGLFSVNVTFTIFNVALVRISRDLHTTQNSLTWAITGPLLLVGVAAPTLGKVGDLRGHRKLYLVGLCGAFLCAVLTAGAWNVGSLITARLFSGLEGACTVAASWSLLFRVFPPEDRTKVMGWWSLIGAGGPVIGVAIGGPVIQAVGWRWVFVAQAPLILVALVINALVLPETDTTLSEKLDIGGAVLLSVTVGSLLFALNKGTDWGWSSIGVLIPLAICPLALFAFVTVERRSDAPLLPLEWLGRRNFVIPCFANVCVNFAYLGGFFLTPILLERGFGYGEGHAGILQIARPLAFSVAAPVAGYLAVRTGERAAAVSGTAVVVLSMLLFTSLRAGSGDFLVILALGLSGIGMGACTPSISASVANAVEIERMGAASAALQLASQVGGVAGIQIMETVQVAREHHAGLVGSFGQAYLVAACVGGLGVAAAFFVRRAPRRALPLLAVETTIG
ncbi:MAG: DHA2 family efflux MFS transporter permease subunit [Acidimicrobiales bacterium]